MTKRQTAEVVGLLIAAYRDNRVTEQTSQVYERMLGDLDYELALLAVNALIRTSKFFPTIAEILETTQKLTRGPDKLGGEAWGEVISAIRFVGHYGVPEFADPLVGRCVELMGWRNLCLSEHDAADRARFIELYDGLVQRERYYERAGLPSPMLPAFGFRNLLPPTPSLDAPKMVRMLPAPTKLLNMTAGSHSGKRLSAAAVEALMGETPGTRDTPKTSQNPTSAEQ